MGIQTKTKINQEKNIDTQTHTVSNEDTRALAEAALALLLVTEDVAGQKVGAPFVRFEPYVVPKQSLTGDTTERVDTRVLQVIYNCDRGDMPIFVGQQMDVFIDAPENPKPE